MDETTILGYLRKELAQYRSDQMSALADGRLADYAEYRHVCGVIRGLAQADALLTDLVQRLEQFDNE